MPAQNAIAKKDNCTACFGDMVGTNLETTKYSGFSTELKDISCATNCRNHPGCEFWVRSVSTSSCWLKQGFRSFDGVEPSTDRRGGFALPESELGIVFIKQPKTGGETLAEVLAQYAVKYGRKQLHDRKCYNKKNPLGQSTCACNIHFVSSDANNLPTYDPLQKPRATMLYTHMFYDPQVLNHFMPAHAVRRLITILRKPADVLKSAQKMALLQHHSKLAQERQLNNSFCQFLADDTFEWVRRCPMASHGDGSILMYLDPNGHRSLSALLDQAKRTLVPPDPKAVTKALRVAVSRLDRDFVVGLQSSYEASILLFEAALGLNRVDTVYSLESMVMHSTSSSHPLVRKLDGEWRDRKEDIEAVLRQRFSPLQYHDLLYDHGVKINAAQVKRFLGNADAVEHAVEKFKNQNRKFTICYENRRRANRNFNTCSQHGLFEAANARRLCTGWIRKEQRGKFGMAADS